MKADRMNFEGMGELDWGKTGMEFEVDEQGQHHAFNHADDVMDTDLVQEGVWQRVRVKTLYPILKKYEYWNNILLKELRGEVRTIQYYIFRESHFILNPPPPLPPPYTQLSVLVQCVYQLAAPHIQRMVRSYFARKHYPTMKLMIVGLARYAACVEIQRIGRGYFNRRETKKQLSVMFDGSAIIIQKNARRKLCYLRAQERRDVLR